MRACQECGEPLDNQDDLVCQNCQTWRDTICSEYGEPLDNQDDLVCQNCQSWNEWLAWEAETLFSVKSLCAKYGWDLTYVGGGSNTRSKYYEIWWQSEPDDDDGYCECEMVRLRISDHPTMYCTEDFSLAMVSGGDDHTLEQLAQRLQKTFVR